MTRIFPLHRRPQHVNLGVAKYRGDMYRLLNKCKSMISGYTKIAETLQKTEDIIKITEKEIKDS